VLPTLGGLYDMSVLSCLLHTHCHGIADFIKNYWIWLIVGIIGGIALIRFLVTNVIPVKRVYERIKFAIPVVNKVAITPEYLRLSKTLRSAYVNGVTRGRCTESNHGRDEPSNLQGQDKKCSGHGHRWYATA